MALEKTFIEFSAKESNQDRNFWASTEWADEETIRTVEIFALPWRDYSREPDAYYPTGTMAFTKSLGELLSEQVHLAIGDGDYREIDMRGRQWRLPTLFLTLMLFPVAVNVVSDNIPKLLPEADPDDEVSLEMIIERPGENCVSLKYRGPVAKLPETLARESLQFCNEETKIQNK